MATLDVNRLMDNLRVRLPGAVDDALRMEIFNALNDFFQDTNIWFEDIEFETIAGEKNYNLFATSPSAIVRLINVTDNRGFVVGAYMDTPGELQLANEPINAQTYVARVTLTINDPLDREGNPVFPMWVLNKYQNDIVDGVLGRMMAQPAKPYSNSQLAVLHARKFSSAIAFARQEANRRNVYRGQRWAFPQSFSRLKTIR
jgi:hypothetical protein